MVVQSIGLVTDLRSQNKNLGVLYQASGLSIEGDGSGGLFWWDSTNTDTDDGVNVIQVTGTSTGRWIRISEALAPDGIVSGGIVTWTGTGLIFNVSACNYFINGVNYKTASTTITLDAADPTYDRIDVFAVNTSKQVVVIKGTPSANPIEPEGDTPTTLGLTNVTIAAGATTPSGVTRELIYDEGTESWTRNFTTSNVSYDPIDSSQYYTGSVSIGITPSPYLANSINLDFTYATELNVVDFKSLTFAIRLSSFWLLNNTTITVQFYNGASVASNKFTIGNTNNVGFSKNLPNIWQFISIAFNNTNIVFTKTKFTRVRISAINIPNKIWVDTICLNDGIGNPPVSTSSKSFGIVSATTGSANATTSGDTLSVVGTGIATTSATGKTLTINVPSLTSDGVISGGIVVWKQVGYQYNVSPCVYFINGTQYTTVSTDVTLTTADPTYDRIDIIAVNSSNQVVIITGTPSANPVEPQVDPSTQLQLTNITVYAGSSVPSGVTTNMIYDENTELWLKTPTGFTADYSNTVTPFYGTYCILATASTTGTKTLKFYKSSIFVNKTDCTAFSFAIKLNQVLLTTESIKIIFANSSTGTNVATYSITSTNVVGFNRSNTSVYQVITIPISAITFSNNNFDSVTLQLVSSRTSISFRLDRMYLQGGINQPTNSYITGTGTVNYVPKWDTTKSLTNSLIYDNGTSVSIGTTSASSDNKFQVEGRIAANVLSSSTTTSVYSIIGNSSVAYPAGGSLSGSYVANAIQGGLNYTFGGNLSVPSGVPTASVIAISGVQFTGIGTVTVSQSGTGIRSLSNLYAQWTRGGNTSGTISHVANIRAVVPYSGSSGTLSITNYYAFLIEDSSQFAPISITNKWGIYQEGINDKNYFAGSIGIGTNSLGTNALRVVGSVRLTTLAGTGTRAVVADTNGELSTQTVTSANETIGLSFLLMGA